MNQKGFTLIELLVVISIIGILAGITFVTFGGSKEKADDGASRAELVQINAITEVWYIGRENFNRYCEKFIENSGTEVGKLFDSIKNRQGDANCKDDDGLEVSFNKKADEGGVKLTISNSGSSDIDSDSVSIVPPTTLEELQSLLLTQFPDGHYSGVCVWLSENPDALETLVESSSYSGGFRITKSNPSYGYEFLYRHSYSNFCHSRGNKFALAFSNRWRDTRDCVRNYDVVRNTSYSNCIGI